MADPQTRVLRAKMLGALLREARLESGKSLKDTAQLIGTTPSTLSSYERGRKSISLPELELLAYHLDLPLRRFLAPSSEDLSRGTEFDPMMMISLRQRMIGALLRRRRTELGYSIRSLAQKVQMPTGRISDYERGRRPIPLPDLESLLEALEQSVDDYIDLEGAIGVWHRDKRAFERFLELPDDLRTFFLKPGHENYLEIAARMSELSLDDLRAVVETLKGLLE